MSERIVKEIPRLPKFPQYYTDVVIYARVSSGKPAQIYSLANQVSGFVQRIDADSHYRLKDIYIDVESGDKYRREMERMLSDARAHKFSVILTKSISRFGINTPEVIKNVRELKSCGVKILFDVENLSTEDADGELLLSIIAGLAEADNESRSDNQNWAIRKRLEDGTSLLYTRPCFGYRLSDDGLLVIDPGEAEVVKMIFNWYLEGHSVVSIIKKLSEAGIKSPKGKDTWYKKSIETMLSNEKYYGASFVMKTFTYYGEEKKRKVNNGEQNMYCIEEDHEGIITKEMFDIVQEEKAKRSNLNADGSRKSIKHTSPK